MPENVPPATVEWLNTENIRKHTVVYVILPSILAVVFENYP